MPTATLTVVDAPPHPAMCAASSDVASVVKAPDGALVRIPVARDVSAGVRDGQFHSPFPSPDETHPATGPIAVHGAEPGDALRVDILDIAVAAVGVELAVKSHSIPPLLPDIARVHRLFDTSGPTIKFRDDVWLPLAPMIGVIGTLPASGSYPTHTPYDHGGNLDVSEMRAGSSVLLPVFVPGGGLFVSDLHAAMGDGEVTGTGIEVSGEVLVRVSVVKDAQLMRPLVETPDAIVTMGSHADFRQAAALAVEDMITLLGRRCGMGREEAFLLIGLAGDVVAAQIVNPNLTAKLRLPLTALPGGSNQEAVSG